MQMVQTKLYTWTVASLYGRNNLQEIIHKAAEKVYSSNRRWWYSEYR